MCKCVKLDMARILSHVVTLTSLKPYNFGNGPTNTMGSNVLEGGASRYPNPAATTLEPPRHRKYKAQR